MAINKVIISVLALCGVFGFLPVQPSFAEILRIGGTGTSLGLIKAAADSFAKTHPGVEFNLPPSLCSTGGIGAVAAGALDIATTSRALRPDERDMGLTEIPYAKTPFLLVTSRKDVRFAIQRAELAAIFGRNQLAWPDGAAIRIVLRPEGETDTALLKMYFPGMSEALANARRVRGIPIAQSDQENLAMAARIPGSLAVTSLTTVVTEGLRLTPLALDGVAPTLQNLESGAYPLSKTLYFVIGPDPSPLALEFIRFLGSPEGHRILRHTGNAPLPLKRLAALPSNRQ